MVVSISNKEDYNIIAADFLEQKIRSINKTKQKVFIALSGGSTPLPILVELRQRQINWDQLYFFIVDERIVPLNDFDSNYGAIKKLFFDYITSASFSMIKDDCTIKDSILEYESTMRELMEFNDDGFPVFDLILLGMGDDGHTASLFPKTSALKENKRIVVENNVPQLKTKRITFTYPTILSAKQIVIIIKGQTKKEIYNQIRSNIKTSFPIQNVVIKREDISWILEE